MIKLLGCAALTPPQGRTSRAYDGSLVLIPAESPWQTRWSALARFTVKRLPQSFTTLRRPCRSVRLDHRKERNLRQVQPPRGCQVK